MQIWSEWLIVLFNEIKTLWASERFNKWAVEEKNDEHWACIGYNDWQHNWMYSSDLRCYFLIAHSMLSVLCVCLCLCLCLSLCLAYIVCTPLSVMLIFLYSNFSTEISSIIPVALNYYSQITSQAISAVWRWKKWCACKSLFLPRIRRGTFRFFSLLLRSIRNWNCQNELFRSKTHHFDFMWTGNILAHHQPNINSTNQNNGSSLKLYRFNGVVLAAIGQRVERSETERKIKKNKTATTTAWLVKSHASINCTTMITINFTILFTIYMLRLWLRLT